MGNRTFTHSEDHAPGLAQPAKADVADPNAPEDPIRPGGPVTVLVALKEPLFGLGVQAALASAPGFEVVGTVSDRAAVEPMVERTQPDVLLIDARFERGGDGSLLPRLADKHPDCKVLVMVDHADHECTVRALLAGPREFHLTPEALHRLKECCLVALRASARGCVPRSAPPEMLLEAVRAVAAGQYWAGPGLTAHGIRWVQRGLTAEASGASLSPREIEVAGLVVDGMANKEIAFRLGLREQTVKNHLSRILEKLGLSSRVELALYAVRSRLA